MAPPRQARRHSDETGSEVTVRYPDGRTRRHGFSRPTIYVGRAPANDVRLPHPFVASRHLMLQIADNDFLVTDLGTGGGTRFHGEELEAYTAQRFREGEVVEVGPLQIEVTRVLDLAPLDDEEDSLAPLVKLRAPARNAPRPVSAGAARSATLEPAAAGGAPDLQALPFGGWRRSPTSEPDPLDRVDGTETGPRRLVSWPRLLEIVAGVAIFAAVTALIVLFLL